MVGPLLGRPSLPRDKLTPDKGKAVLLQLTNNTITFPNMTLSFHEFPSFVVHHLKKAEGTQQLELEGIHLQSNDFTVAELEHFIRHVCRWGGYPGIAGRILKQNRIESIQTQFIRATNILSASIPDVQSALEAVNHIRQLGSISFATKHLRFLRPDVCPVLDSLISKNLGYSLIPTGYKQFSGDCSRIAETLQMYAIRNPRNRDNSRWFAADVEMALFARLNNWQIMDAACQETP